MKIKIMNIKKLHEPARGEKGQSLVELIIAIPILVALILGAMAMGKIFNTYLVLHNASRDAALFASSLDVNNSGNLNLVRNKAQNFVLTSITASSPVSGIQCTAGCKNIDATWSTFNDPTNSAISPELIRYVRVNVIYNGMQLPFFSEINTLFPSGSMLPATLDFTVSSTMPVLFSR